MMEVFGSDVEFGRMAIEMAQDLDMELEFAPGTEILETRGCEGRVEGSRIFYRLPVLHQGDYETILVRYRLPPLEGDTYQLAAFRVKTQTASGDTVQFPEETLGISLADTSEDEISSDVVRYSDAMMGFVDALKEIGSLYYAADNPGRLEAALGKIDAAQAELEKAKRTLPDAEAFAPELAVLANYTTTIRNEMSGNSARTASRNVDSISSRPAVAAAAAAPPLSPNWSAPPAVIIPRMPDPRSTKVYRVQAGAFLVPENAETALSRLRAVGYSPTLERFENYYRVVISGVRARDVQGLSYRIGYAGFEEAWLREE
jgi:hypothetical protein